MFPSAFSLWVITPLQNHFDTAFRTDFAAPVSARQALPPRLVQQYNLKELSTSRPHSEGVLPIPKVGENAKVMNTTAHSAFGGPFAKDEARRAVPRLDLGALGVPAGVGSKNVLKKAVAQSARVSTMGTGSGDLVPQLKATGAESTASQRTWMYQQDPIIAQAHNPTPRVIKAAPTSIRGLDNESTLNRMRSYPLPTQFSNQMHSSARRAPQVWADWK